MQLVDKLLKGLLPLGWPLQLQQHVFHGKVVRHETAIIHCFGLRMGVAGESVELGLIDFCRD